MSEELSALVSQTDRERLKNVLKVMEENKEVIINTDADFQRINNLMNHYKDEINKVEKLKREAIKPYYSPYKELLDTYNGVIKKVYNFVNNCAVSLGCYKREDDRKKEEAQAKLDAEARKRRELEMERAKHDQKVAAQMREEGKETSAEKREADAQTHFVKAAETVAPVAEKLEAGGTYFVKEYEAIEKDKRVAIESMVKDNTLITFISIDLKKLSKKQKTDNGTLEIPGIDFTWKEKPIKKGRTGA